MFPALTQLLPRVSYRCFTSRAAILNAFPTSSSRSFRHPRPSGPYDGISIGTNSRGERDPDASWNNQVGHHVAPEMTPADRWRQNSLSTVAALQRFQIPDAYTGLRTLIMPNANPNLNSLSGRSIRVKEGHFAEAVRDLERVLSRNQVRATLRNTERHEKKGVKRRRIHSEQWRKHFAHQVRAWILIQALVNPRF